MLRRVLAWIGVGDAADERETVQLDDADAEYGGTGPRRRYTCPECGATIEAVGPDAEVTCSDCHTVFKGVLVPDHAVCPDCGSRIDDCAFYPATRRDTEFAACSCGYRWESDPR